MKRIPIWTQGLFDIKKDKLWFIPFEMSALCRVDLSSFKIDKSIALPNISVCSGGFFTTFCFDDYVIGAPAYDDKLYFCNTKIDEDNTDFIDMKRSDGEYESFYLYTKYGKSVYVFPINYPYIIKVTIKECGISFDKIECNYNMIVSLCTIKEKTFFVDRTASVKSFDMSTESFDVVIESEKGKAYRNIARLEDNTILLIDQNGRGELFYLDRADNNCQFIFDTGKAIYSIIVANGKAFLFPEKDDRHIIIVSLTDYSLSEIELDRGDMYQEWFGPAFSEPIVVGNNIYVMSPHHKCLYVLSTDTLETDKHYFFWEGNKEAEGHLSNAAFSLKYTYEGNPWFFNLQNMITGIVNK